MNRGTIVLGVIEVAGTATITLHGGREEYISMTVSAVIMVRYCGGYPAFLTLMSRIHG
jgi:hypothetical protein